LASSDSIAGSSRIVLWMRSSLTQRVDQLQPAEEPHMVMPVSSQLVRLLACGCLVAAFVAAPAHANILWPASQHLQMEEKADEPLVPPGGFKVRASNGYSIFVFGARAWRGKPAAVLVFVTGKHGGAIYSAPGTVTETSIQADLAALGEIAVTFRPSGQRRKARSVCDEKPVTFDSGYYEGTIAFRGEQSYTKVEATTARGNLGPLLNIVCPGLVGTTGGPFLPGAELEVVGDRRKQSLHLTAVKNRPRARVRLEASVSEEKEGIRISRFIGMLATSRAFEYDPKVKAATVSPPDPFSGAAHFARGAKPANRWTGDLTVDLPGRSGVKLTGSETRAKLVHAHWERIAHLAG
jgi:hypothetical protein